MARAAGAAVAVVQNIVDGRRPPRAAVWAVPHYRFAYFEGHTVSVSDGHPLRKEFRTAQWLSANTPMVNSWVCYPWAARGCITLLSGSAKGGGKTTFLHHMIKAVLAGTHFLDEDGQTEQTPVVYVTEEGDQTFVEATRRNKIDKARGLHVLTLPRAAGTSGKMPDWPTVISETFALAREHEARLVVIDTFAQFSGLAGEQENQAAAILQALSPLKGQMTSDFAVIIVHHDGKTAKSVEYSSRGSSALPGAVDIVVRIRQHSTEKQEKISDKDRANMTKVEIIKAENAHLAKDETLRVVETKGRLTGLYNFCVVELDLAKGRYVMVDK